MGQQPEPSVAQYADGAKTLASWGSIFISMAGGEPLLRQDLPEITAALAKYHFPFVTTNGWLVTPEIAEALMNAGLWGVSISIDYADPAKHDAARGMDGAWAQAWRAVELFSAARKYDYQRVNVMGVLLDDNLDELEEIMQRAARHKAYFMVQPYGFRKINSHQFDHKDGQVSPRLLEMWERNPNFLSNPDYLEKFDEFLAGGIPGCRAGQAFFNIDSTGDIAICVENRPRPIANLLRDSQYKIRDRLREASRINPCTACWYNCRGEVETLYQLRGVLHSLPSYLHNRGEASGKMGRWTMQSTTP